MKILAFTLFLTCATEAFAQQVIIIQPRQQSNSLWNPANPNRPWVDYTGRTGREREAGTVKQWIVTPVTGLRQTGRVFPNLQPTGRTVIIINTFNR